jgi:hypothetical protein
MKNEPFRILILSDIHFGSWSHYTGDYSPALNKPREWAARLLQELAVCLQPPAVVAPPPYDSIVLNGDLTSLCEEEGFAAARILINGLIKQDYIRSPRDFVLLPGNHDVRRDPDGRPLTQTMREAAFREKYREFLGREHDSEKHLGVLRLYKQQKVALIGLDSCRVEGSDNPGIGYIGFDQLDSLVSTLEVEEETHGPFRRIAFVHHHIETPASSVPDWMLTPGEDRRFSFMADAKRIQEGLLYFKIDFLFHGHFHTPELNAEANRLRSAGRIISAGSVAGAVSRCAGKTREFMLLELTDDRLVVHDFRRKGAGDWIPNRVTFNDLPPRRSVELSEGVRASRKERIFDSVSELNRYGRLARASSFFAGDAAAMTSVKRELADSDLWKKDPRGYEKAWRKLADYLENNGKRALERYRKALLDPNDEPNLEQYVFRILRRLKA